MLNDRIKNMDIRNFIKNNIVLLDGSMGTMLQNAGLPAGTHPSEWNLTNPDKVTAVHKAYFDAGTNIVNTDTFGITSFTFDHEKLERIIKAAVANARKAAEESNGSQPKFISLDIGPSGKMLKPYGEVEFEDMVRVFAENIKAGVAAGVDMITIETMNDSYETKAAVLAAKENSNLPIIVTNSFGTDGKLMTGADAEAMIAMLEALGVDAIGMNCSMGPDELASIAEEYLKLASVPVVLKPNAGMPRLDNGKTVYDVTPQEFASSVAKLVEKGVRIVGGCCGTTPEYIRELAEKIKDVNPAPIQEKNITAVSSYTHAIRIGERRNGNDEGYVLIGERINPTGRKVLRQAIADGNISMILNEAVNQADQGADILDVNAGVAGMDESETMPMLVKEIQSVTDLPLQIDTGNPAALEAALRIYNGKPLVNSVNGKAESMKAVFPLAKKYGASVIALTLDENGIPESADGRIEIAEKILKEAEKYGISKKDIIFDTLVMTVSTDKDAANVTLKALKKLHDMGCLTSLGISNVSFGLPERSILNSTFLKMAAEAGLDAAIYNPGAARDVDDEFARDTLEGNDDGCLRYISHIEEMKAIAETASGETIGSADIGSAKSRDVCQDIPDIRKCIIKGLKSQAKAAAQSLLTDHDPIKIISDEIIPALNSVGDDFGAGRLYLPQLLMSAEAASEALDVVKSTFAHEDRKSSQNIILATVQGDIHDIGKNICKLLLESYGYSVIDLGKDVAPEKIEAAINKDTAIVGLSALMTTTLPAMEETVQIIKSGHPDIRIIIGGAVITGDYAESIGVDYSKDAMEMVSYAKLIAR